MTPRLPSWLGLVFMLLAGIGIGVVCFGGAPPPHQVPTAQGEVWTCSMHPQVRQNEPGACPICGMDLIPAGGATDSDVDRVILSPRARALARLRTTEVARRPGASADVRLLGRIEPDETTRKNVTTWVGGRIDRLHVNTTGERVRKGQVIATIYSPEVYTAHQDLLTAAAQVERLAGGSAVAAEAARAALGAARDRLALLGVSEQQLDRMASASQPTRGLSIRSPFAGTVIERVATEGSYVQTGAPLYRIADLDRLWVQLDAYEADLQRLGVGQSVVLTVEGVDERLEGQVSFIDPTLDPQRRTARVRVAVPNTDDRLRTGMFVEAVVAAPTGDQAGSPLVIPETAPLFTGRRSIVYVEHDTPEGLAYTPRTVRLGPKLGSDYPVVAGLSAGERIVSRGAFAIDADLQIQGGASMMASDDADASRWEAVVEISSSQRAMLAPVVDHYLAVQRALAEDDLASATSAARELTTAVTTIELDGSAAEPWNELVDRIRTHSGQVGASTDLQGARGGFEPLSGAIAGLLRTFGNPLEEAVQLAHCPMANSNQGATWVQQGPTVDNAYFGAMMRTCGDIRNEVPPGGFLPAATSAPAAPHAGHDH